MNGSDGRSERHWMGFISVAVGEVMIVKMFGDLCGGGAEAERDVGGSDSLRGDQNIGPDIPVIHGELCAGASPAGHHFVGDQQNAMSVTDLAKLAEILDRRNQDTVGADYRLRNYCRDVAFVGDHVLDVVGAGDPAGWISVLDGTFVAVHFGGEDEALALAG